MAKEEAKNEQLVYNENRQVAHVANITSAAACNFWAHGPRHLLMQFFVHLCLLAKTGSTIDISRFSFELHSSRQNSTCPVLHPDADADVLELD